MNNVIYLVGFMGCGKTTIGHLLGKKIGNKSIDLDDYIEAYTNRSIPEIFQEEGEVGFRAIESHCLKQLGKMGKGIICTGGGVVKEQLNREYLKSKCCIYLKVDFEIVYQRIIGDPKRPLAKSREHLKALYDERQGWYEEVATYTIIGDHKAPFQVIDEIIQKIK